MVNSLNESLNKVGNLKGIGKKIFDEIIKAFTILSENFLNLVGNLTEQMFKFLTQFQSIVKTKDYQVSKIDVKIPSVTFEPVPLFTFSIPIPKIESPEILITIENKSI